METVITNKATCQEILNILTNLTTKIASISDSPVNASNIIEITITYHNQAKLRVTIYEKGKNYFLEEPYNGIYKLTKREYNQLISYQDKIHQSN